jgi:hypothetical protein
MKNKLHVSVQCTDVAKYDDEEKGTGYVGQHQRVNMGFQNLLKLCISHIHMASILSEMKQEEIRIGSS